MIHELLLPLMARMVRTSFNDTAVLITHDIIIFRLEASDRCLSRLSCGGKRQCIANAERCDNNFRNKFYSLGILVVRGGNESTQVCSYENLFGVAVMLPSKHWKWFQHWLLYSGPEMQREKFGCGKCIPCGLLLSSPLYWWIRCEWQEGRFIQ